jgi:glycosylphosphatidylinositol transamidase
LPVPSRCTSSPISAKAYVKYISIISRNPTLSKANKSAQSLPTALNLLTLLSIFTPPTLAYILKTSLRAKPQQLQILQSLSLLLIGASYSTLATLNFSLAFVVGLLTTPLAFVRQTESRVLVGVQYVVLVALSPMSATYAVGLWWYRDQGLAAVLVELAKGWVAQGVWTEFVVWGVWWPAWIVGGTVVWSGVF